MTMTETQLLSKRKLAEFAAYLFNTTGHEMYEAHDAKGRLLALAEALRNLQPRLAPIDPDATAILTDRMSQAAQCAGAALARLESGSDGCDANDAVLALAAGLDDLGAAVLAGARSLTRPKLDLLDPAVLQPQQPAAFVATELMLTADALRHSLDLGYLGRTSFSFPVSDDGGCGCSTGGRVVGSIAQQLSGDFLKLDGYDLAEALQGLGEILKRLSGVFKHFGLFFEHCPEGFVGICDNQCPVAGRRIRGPVLSRAFGNDNGNSWVPGFDIDWTVCCTCTCAILIPQRQLLLFTTTHTLNGTNIPNTRPVGVAINAATVAANREIAGFGVPGFVPNAAIAPPLAIPACPPPGGC